MNEEYETVVQIFVEPQDYMRAESALRAGGVPFYCAGEWGQYTTLEEIEADLENK